MSEEPLLAVENLKTHFYTERGRVTAVDGVSFSVQRGEIVGIVGESGCGKSVMSQSLLRLLEHTDEIEYEGKVLFENQNLLDLPLSRMRKIRGNEISMIFQDPLTSLNPLYTIGDQIAEGIAMHQKLPRKAAMKRAVEMLRLTGIPSPEERARSYPHELSGGMQQRAVIAMALSCEPKLLIADEPTTALDVTIQAQILELIAGLNKRLNMGVLFITHDLGVVSEICDSVKVMYLGQIVEEAPADRLFSAPLHPYTQGLIRSLPKISGNRDEPLHVIPGTVPPLSQVPQGCRFAARCPFADEQCRQSEPPVEKAGVGRRVKCWHYAKISRSRSGEGIAE
ncbi:ATP-binding cassette domain-containing protein [Paenibacillus macerans]|uniref:ATP-binding cassette domain-containing protein n=1 Tax=Paenibacillus macerans TaxID=44252 RepID=A0A6N8F0E7_PAEMA|nr:ABC transporter ATP-binding protein [Paenibacillus macerans]MDU5947442.1 ABC transporter ATP-binding protein [Paenibacillus macerans]MED4954296.1 ABC transporter ATP-binding protein [Paenibacillus macerans]MUG25434.1 ATP-binding cassette domain-containing protein [Paenibacillus macerans]UMV50647.1 ABC transporter ATP-binding protein [Paenibacillus macerans]